MTDAAAQSPRCHSDVTISLLIHEPLELFKAEVSWKDQRGHEYQGTMEIYSTEKAGDPSDTKGPNHGTCIGRGRQISLSLEMAVEVSRSYLLRCDNDHEECKEADALASPRRLIEPRPQISTDFKTLAIVETVDVVSGLSHGSESLRYIALIHCWGSSLPTRLLKSNVAKMRAGFSMRILPLLFRDAAKFTYLLGICYLWIDALTIVQDSPSDWATESAKMAASYGHSYATLAISFLPGNREGFLNFSRYPKVHISRYEGHFRHERFLYKPRESHESRLLHSSLHVGDGIFVRDYTDYMDDDEPPNTRAWAFQEYLLGRRVI